jgi:hypothetical protein
VKRDNLTAICVTAAGALSMWATPAFAYLGPGTGLAAIGTFLALIVGVIAAFFGFVWYPVKRLLRKGKAAGAYPSEPHQKPHAASVDEST